MKPKVIAVVGGKKIDKTTTTENIIAELVKRGYKVAAIKHISEPEWIIDTPSIASLRDEPSRDSNQFIFESCYIITS